MDDVELPTCTDAAARIVEQGSMARLMEVRSMCDRRLIAMCAPAVALWLVAMSPQVPEGRIYVLHSKAVGACPALDWHIVAEANDILAGMISWDDMKTMARATGRVNRQSQTFTLTAVETGGRAGRATVVGKIQEDGTIIADIKGPNVVCQSVIVRAYGAPPVTR